MFNVFENRGNHAIWLGDIDLYIFLYNTNYNVKSFTKTRVFGVI